MNPSQSLRALIVYDSIGGQSEATARAVASELKAEGYHVTLKSVHVTEPEEVEDVQLLVVGTWVYPLPLWQLPSREVLNFVAGLPSLEGKKAAVFATHLFNADRVIAKLEAALHDRHAEIVALHQVKAFAPEAGARAFAQMLSGRLTHSPYGG
jgi:flavodoxin